MLFMGKSTISMAMFNSKLFVYQGVFFWDSLSKYKWWDIMVFDIQISVNCFLWFSMVNEWLHGSPTISFRGFKFWLLTIKKYNGVLSWNIEMFIRQGFGRCFQQDLWFMITFRLLSWHLQASGPLMSRFYMYCIIADILLLNGDIY